MADMRAVQREFRCAACFLFSGRCLSFQAWPPRRPVPKGESLGRERGGGVGEGSLSSERFPFPSLTFLSTFNFIRNSREKLLVALVALLIAASPAFAEEAKELNVFSWSEYIPQEVVNGFTKETGIKVVLSTYESNEAMYAKLKLLGAKGYDLVVPSGYFVEVMAQDNLLAKLDKSKIKGLDNLDPASLNQPFDKGNALTIPYMWGTVGLLVNKKAVDVSTIKSWKDLARPEFKGRVLLSDDLRDTFGVGLKACGYSINSTNPDEIKAAYEWLKALKPSVRVFDVTATKQAFISEEVVAGLAWNGDAFIAMQENPDLEFIVPEEGMMIWLDNFAIPAGAEHKENAYKFISYLMRPEVAKLCVEEFNYSTPNKAAEKILEPEYAESKVIVLDPEELAKGEVTVNVGKARELYEKYWEQLKAGD